MNRKVKMQKVTDFWAKCWKDYTEMHIITNNSLNQHLSSDGYNKKILLYPDPTVPIM